MSPARRRFQNEEQLYLVKHPSFPRWCNPSGRQNDVVSEINQKVKLFNMTLFENEQETQAEANVPCHNKGLAEI